VWGCLARWPIVANCKLVFLSPHHRFPFGVDVTTAAFGVLSLVGVTSRQHNFVSECVTPQFARKRRAAVDRVGVIPIPSKTAPSEVPLKMLSYCSILRPVLYGCLRMRAKTPPVTSSHAPKRSSYLYLETACSGVWSIISAAENHFCKVGW
jgi:hypothetical protein